MERETLAWSFVPLREAKVLSSAREQCKARARGQIWLTSGNSDNPSPGPEPLTQVKLTERQTTDTGTRTLAPPGVWGASRDGVFCGLQPHAARTSCPRGHCPEKSGVWAAFTCFPLLLSHLGDHWQVSW
jgi:hypothetical protein